MKAISTLVCLALTTATLSALGAEPAAARRTAAGSQHVTLAQALQPWVDNHSIAGAVAIVADREKVLDLEAVGSASLATKAPMQTDSLFWLASMTKPFTATALMMLVDEGKVNVDDPVEEYLPEFKGQQVADEQDKTSRHPPQHPITIKELLSHTSGIVGPHDPPFQRTFTLKGDVAQYAAAPLKWEPGTRYEYNNSGINTAGRIIEVASGMPYGEFVQRRLLDPLGMCDTTFWPNEEQSRRLAMTSQFNPDSAVLEDLAVKTDETTFAKSLGGLRVPYRVLIYDGNAIGTYSHRYAWPAGGLYSSAADVARFAQMVLNGGLHQGKHLLSAAAVKRMTSIQPEKVTQGPQPACGLGWFVKRNDDEGPSAGSFGHRGARGPVMWIDPEHQLAMILLIESMDIHQRGQPPGVEQKALDASFFHAAIDHYGKSAGRPDRE